MCGDIDVHELCLQKNAMNICVCTSYLWLCGVVVGFVSLVIGCTRWLNSVYILIFVLLCVYVNSHVLLDHHWCKVLSDMVSKTNKYMYIIGFLFAMSFHSAQIQFTTR